MIREEAQINSKNLSDLEIKKRAIYLKKLSSPDFYEDEIKQFLEQDKISFPKKEAIVFTGSSSIVFWKSLEDDMFPLPVINRGFGGAHIVHVNYHFEEIIVPYKPKGIVFFCGTNDLAALKTPEKVFGDFKVFFDAVKTFLPTTKVFVIGIKPSVARHYLRQKELSFNKLTSDLSEQEDNLLFIDVWEEMLSGDGEANPYLFAEDGLHMNEEGYKIWSKKIKPLLIKHFLP